MKRPEGFLELGIVIFKVLAWVSLVVQVVVGIIVLVVGGEPVPIGGVDVPARLVGLLNCVAGAMYFFVLLLVARVIRVLLEIHKKGVGTAEAF